MCGAWGSGNRRGQRHSDRAEERRSVEPEGTPSTLVVVVGEYGGEGGGERGERVSGRVVTGQRTSALLLRLLASGAAEMGGPPLCLRRGHR